MIGKQFHFHITSFLLASKVWALLMQIRENRGKYVIHMTI